MDANERLEKFLQENHPEILKDAKQSITTHPDYDLMDACDDVASDVYFYWCEHAE